MPTFAGKNQMRHGTHFTGLLREASRILSSFLANVLINLFANHLNITFS